MQLSTSIPAERTRLIYNGVDCRRFGRHQPLAPKPRRALIFSNYAGKGTHLEAIEEACRSLGIHLDVVGAGVGAEVAAPEQILGNYDLVFAKARCALEAMASGSAVILCDTRGLGGMVTRENVEEMREWNFGMRCLNRPFNPGEIIREIGLYSVPDAGAVSAFIRETASHCSTTRQYNDLYKEIAVEAVREPVSVSISAVISQEARRIGTLEVALRSIPGGFMRPISPRITNLLGLRILDAVRSAAPASHLSVNVELENRSNETLASTRACPVLFAYHWFDARSNKCVEFEGERTPLIEPMHKDSMIRQMIRIKSPEHEGIYRLRVTLVQEGCFWFDETADPLFADWTIECIGAQGPNAERELRLSEVREWGGFEVVRDAAFSNLGFLSSPLPKMLTFVEARQFAAPAARLGQMTAVITTPELADQFPDSAGVGVTQFPRRAFSAVHNYLAGETTFYGAVFPSIVDPRAKAHPRSFVADRNVVIGRGVVIGPNATVLEGAIIDDDCIIDAGAVIGAEGFQTSRFGEEMIDMTHAGGVRLGRGTRVMANAVVARGVFRQLTLLGRAVRIGNSAFVSHNTLIGDRTIVGHGSVINGDVRLGEDVWIGPGVTVSNGIRIGDKAHVSLGSAVIRDVGPGQQVIGSIALDQRKMLRAMSKIAGGGHPAS